MYSCSPDWRTTGRSRLVVLTNYTLLNLQQYMGTQETLRCALTQTHHSHHNQSCNQNQHEHSPNNNHHQPDEKNNEPHRQCFNQNNYNNGNMQQLQHHPYHRNSTNNNQATLNNRGQQPDCNHCTGCTQLPPSVPPPKCPASQQPNDMNYADNHDQQPGKNEVTSIKINMIPTTPTNKTKFKKTPTNTP